MRKAAAGCLLALLAACGSSTQGTLTVFAASSLTDAFERIESDFEADHPDIDVTLNLAASSTLATQITEGADADVFASADARQMDRVAEAAAPTHGPFEFASNSLALVVEEGNPSDIGSIADLARTDVVVVLGAPEVPIGRYTARLLAAAGVEPAVTSLEPNVRAVLAKVELGEADVGVVYRSDALSSSGVDVVELSDDLGPAVTYPIAALDDDPAAIEFVEYVLSDAGRRHLDATGFGR